MAPKIYPNHILGISYSKNFPCRISGGISLKNAGAILNGIFGNIHEVVLGKRRRNSW